MKLATLLLGAGALAVAGPGAAADRAAVVETYADIATAGYGDSLATAERLGAAVDALIAEPSAEALQAAKAAWLAARVPYQQTEAFRFGNAIVDEWEGKVNAWPLDEGLIDYVDPAYGGATDENPYAVLNVIANPKFTLSGGEVDATEITPDAAREHAAGGRRDRGQRRDRLPCDRVPALGPGPERHRAGRRQPALDRLRRGGGLHRRQLRPARGYLKAATDLLVSDLEWIVAQWGEGGEAREALTSDPDAGMVAILTGMGASPTASRRASGCGSG